ncbi:MAG TPA: CHAP domain-containing protein [Archangium sp.]|nr:CHAP domain-containing protein [Archangium sp.]
MKKTLIKLMLGFATLSLAACGAATEEMENQTPAAEASVDETATAEQQLYCAACGTVLASLDGVAVYSNGNQQATGYNCVSTAGSYGSRYQCVEFARRYWAVAQGNSLPYLGASGYASQLCDQAPNGFTKHYAGYRPVHGDLIVLPGVPGHVAVVDSADASYAYTYEQNGACSGRATYALSSARCFLHPL